MHSLVPAELHQIRKYLRPARPPGSSDGTADVFEVLFLRDQLHHQPVKFAQRSGEGSRGRAVGGFGTDTYRPRISYRTLPQHNLAATSLTDHPQLRAPNTVFGCLTVENTSLPRRRPPGRRRRRILRRRESPAPPGVWQQFVHSRNLSRNVLLNTRCGSCSSRVARAKSQFPSPPARKVAGTVLVRNSSSWYAA